MPQVAGFCSEDALLEREKLVDFFSPEKKKKEARRRRRRRSRNSSIMILPTKFIWKFCIV
jgi:hypothetical protein